MPLPTEQFKAQARKAGWTLSWRLQAAVAGFFALFIAALGVLLLSSAPWFGVLAFVVSAGIVAYAFRRIGVGRHRDVICPNCGGRGEVLLIQQSYQFHCSRCDQTADTGISTTGA